MVPTHIEFASDIETTRCAACARDTVTEAVLVNRYGLVLARVSSCVHCGHTRHRTHRNGGRDGRKATAPVPRIA
jgi:hypothetical protein